MKSSGVLVDTSVWISYLNGGEEPEVAALMSLIRQDQKISICPVIVQETLQGIKSDSQFKLVKESLLSFDVLEWEPIEAALSGALIYRTLRKKGVTIRKSNNCTIAAFARKFDMQVLHIDRDFEIMSKVGIISQFKPF